MDNVEILHKINNDILNIYNDLKNRNILDSKSALNDTNLNDFCKNFCDTYIVLPFNDSEYELFSIIVKHFISYALIKNTTKFLNLDELGCFIQDKNYLDFIQTVKSYFQHGLKTNLLIENKIKDATVGLKIKFFMSFVHIFSNRISIYPSEYYMYLKYLHQELNHIISGNCRVADCFKNTPVNLLEAFDINNSSLVDHNKFNLPMNEILNNSAKIEEYRNCEQMTEIKNFILFIINNIYTYINLYYSDIEKPLSINAHVDYYDKDKIDTEYTNIEQFLNAIDFLLDDYNITIQFMFRDAYFGYNYYVDMIITNNTYNNTDINDGFNIKAGFCIDNNFLME